MGRLQRSCSSCRSGGTGRRAGLKIPCPQGREGSTPSSGTTPSSVAWCPTGGGRTRGHRAGEGVIAGAPSGHPLLRQPPDGRDSESVYDDSIASPPNVVANTATRREAYLIRRGRDDRCAQSRILSHTGIGGSPNSLSGPRLIPSHAPNPLNPIENLRLSRTDTSRQKSPVQLLFTRFTKRIDCSV